MDRNSGQQIWADEFHADVRPERWSGSLTTSGGSLPPVLAPSTGSLRVSRGEFAARGFPAGDTFGAIARSLHLTYSRQIGCVAAGGKRPAAGHPPHAGSRAGVDQPGAPVPDESHARVVGHDHAGRHGHRLRQPERHARASERAHALPDGDRAVGQGRTRRRAARSWIRRCGSTASPSPTAKSSAGCWRSPVNGTRAWP